MGYMSKNIFCLALFHIPVLIFTDLSVMGMLGGHAKKSSTVEISWKSPKKCEELKLINSY